MFLIIIILFMQAMMASPSPQEDDLTFNCHVHGNHICGPGTPWHGFVNLPGL